VNQAQPQIRRESRPRCDDFAGALDFLEEAGGVVVALRERRLDADVDVAAKAEEPGFHGPKVAGIFIHDHRDVDVAVAEEEEQRLAISHQLSAIDY